MENMNLNNILHREQLKQEFMNILCLNENRHIYLYGESGIGKTEFVMNILKELNYDIITYDCSEIRNANFIEELMKPNVTNKNILSILNKNNQQIAIIMDDIDGMNKGDKGGINALIKAIRPAKKTKKTTLTNKTNLIPIICISNDYIDKKIKELMKYCNVFSLHKPTNEESREILITLCPDLMNADNLLQNMIHYSRGDLRKINSIYKIYIQYPDLINNIHFLEIFDSTFYNEDTKKIISKLLENNYPMNEHNYVINETDRTSVGLLWHENIIDYITNQPNDIPFYIQQLENTCFADYIDRITFQKQIWQFNEMTSLLKTFYNHKLFHQFNMHTIPTKKEIRFTKILTKYSTEYNNLLFIQRLCNKLGIDKKDLFALFLYLRENEKLDIHQMLDLFENNDIYKLEIQRMYRYLDKYIKENAEGITDQDDISEVDILDVHMNID